MKLLLVIFYILQFLLLFYLAFGTFYIFLFTIVRLKPDIPHVHL